MSNILNASRQKVATLEENGEVRNMENTIIGYVHPDGNVYDEKMDHIGDFRPDGNIYRGATHIGMIKAGKAYNVNGQYEGEVAGDHIESGCAALLLLIV